MGEHQLKAKAVSDAEARAKALHAEVAPLAFMAIIQTFAANASPGDMVSSVSRATKAARDAFVYADAFVATSLSRD